MKKVYLKNQLKGYPIEVISNVLDVINVLGENYGANRDIEKDLGGYIVIAENIVVIEMLKTDKLQGLIPANNDMIIGRDLNLEVLSRDKVSKVFEL